MVIVEIVIKMEDFINANYILFTQKKVGIVNTNAICF